ncbi:MAG: class I SAM-dependent methyltransferase [Anaerolineae bacterium]|nr:class I SAM-dependent methyltransferase [Anaerolineae bacterium]
MEQIDRHRFFTMAEAYDRVCQRLVPGYDFLQDEVLRITGGNEKTDATIVDLGAGSGIFLEKALSRWPDAKAHWVDYSEDFLSVARQRLARFDGRVVYTQASFEDDWESQVEGQADLIFSMSAIHHLENADKQRLYQRCFDKLAPGGWLFNVDEMKTLRQDGYLANMRFWVGHVQETRGKIAEEHVPYYEKWRSHFDNWELRNVVNVDVPKTKGDDIHEHFTTQVNWLHEIGFANADVYIKYYLWCAVGGRKPHGKQK